MKRISRIVGLLVLCVTLLAPLSARAVGNEPAGGVANYQAIKWYYYPRHVTNPASPGPEVAYFMASGSMALSLGTHDCSQGGAGPVYRQYIGLVEPVRYYPAAIWFCTFTYSSSGSGSFTGHIYWD